MSSLDHDIGELVTNDAGAGRAAPLGIRRDAALVVDGRPGRLDRPGRRRAGRRPTRRRRRRGRCCPASSTRHAHLVFAGDRGGRVRRPDGRRAVHRRRHPHHRRGDPGRLATTSCAPTSRRLRRRDALRQGTTTVEIKSGYGLTVADEARCAADRRRVHRRDHLPRRARRARRSTPTGPTSYVDLVCGPMLDACAPYARWIDVFCERGAFDADQARAILTAGAAAGPAAAGARQPARPGPGRPARPCELGAASRRPLHPPDRRRRRRAGRLRHRRHAAARASSSPPGRRTRTPGGCSTPASPSRWPPTATPGSSYTSSMPFCIALAVREMRMTPAEAVWAATAGGAGALRRDDVGAPRRRRAGRPGRPGRAVAPAPGLPAGRAHWSARSCTTE